MRRVYVVLLLFFLFTVSRAEAAYLDLAWSPNGEPDLAGYKIYYGTSSQDYINFVDVGLVTSYRLDELLDDTAYFVAVTAYDTAGNESDFSEEASGLSFPDQEDAGITSPQVQDGKSGGCFIGAVVTNAGP
jgi:fibronectin type 3 domain-containing protein